MEEQKKVFISIPKGITAKTLKILKDNADDTGIVSLSQNEISKKIECNKYSVLRSISYLKDKELIKLVNVDHHNRNSHNTYQILI